MNEQNLRTPTSTEAREIGRKGGIASGRARLAKKHGRELVQALLAAKEPDPAVLAEVAKSFGLDESQVTKEVAMQTRQIDKAIRKADTKAYTVVSKVAGFLDETKEVNVRSADGSITITLASPKAVAGLQRAIQNGAQPAAPEGE
jgi:hypothetical protein